MRTPTVIASTLVLIFGQGASGAEASNQGEADPRIRPYESYARLFLREIAEERFERAFQMLSDADVRYAVQIKGAIKDDFVRSKRERFLKFVQAEHRILSFAANTRAQYSVVRHDDDNLTVRVTIDESGINGMVILRLATDGDAIEVKTLSVQTGFPGLTRE